MSLIFGIIAIGIILYIIAKIWDWKFEAEHGHKPDERKLYVISNKVPFNDDAIIELRSISMNQHWIEHRKDGEIRWFNRDKDTNSLVFWTKSEAYDFIEKANK